MMVHPSLLDPRDLSSNEAVESKSPGAAATVIFLMSMCSVMLAIRLWSRLVAARDRLWWDDWCALLAWPFCMYFCIVVLMQFEGLTRKRSIAMTMYGANATYYVGIFLVKVSVLFFYGRVFRSKGQFRRWLWIVGIFNLCVAITFVFLATFYCTPARKVWEPTVPGHCVKIEAIYLSATILHALTDIVILAMPMKSLLDLQLAKHAKVGLVAVFALGYSVPILSLIKLGFVAKEAATKTESRSDFLAPLILTMCETPIGITLICIPAAYSMGKHVGHFGMTSLFRSYASSERRSNIAMIHTIPTKQRDNSDSVITKEQTGNSSPQNLDSFAKGPSVVDEDYPESVEVEIGRGV